MAEPAGYDIPKDDIGIVKTVFLQIIRQVAKQSGNKNLRQKTNIYRGTRHLPSLLQELSQFLHPDLWGSDDHAEDLALCFQMNILELRKANPETFSWIPGTLETDEVHEFFLRLTANLNTNLAHYQTLNLESKNSAHGHFDESTTESNTGYGLQNQTAPDTVPEKNKHSTTSSSVSDNTEQTLLVTSAPLKAQTEISECFSAKSPVNVQQHTVSFLANDTSVTNWQNAGFSINSTIGPKVPHEETGVPVTSKILSLVQQLSSSLQTVNVALQENTAYPETHTSITSCSNNLNNVHLADVFSGTNVMSTSTTDYDSGVSIKQTSSEQQTVAASLLALASAVQGDNSYRTPEINPLSSVGFTPTVHVARLDSSEFVATTSSATSILPDGTCGHTADSSQETMNVDKSKGKVSTSERIPLTGKELEQAISCLHNAKKTKKPRTRCQYCDSLDEVDISVYKDIRGMSQMRKEQTIREHIKSALPLSKGKGKRKISNEYSLPYQDGKHRRVCRETFEKYFKTCRDTISKVTKESQRAGDGQTCSDAIDKAVNRSQQEVDDTDCLSVVQTALKNHIKRFLSDKMKFTAVNGNYCKMEWTYLPEINLQFSLYVYNKTCEREMKCSVDEELFKEVMESVNIRVLGDDDERLYWYGVCRICDLLENSAAGESSEQQLKQHQVDADRVNRYCDRVMTTQEEQGVLYVYMDVDITDRHLYFRHNLPLCRVTLIDLKSKVVSYFMWEFVRAGFGAQHLLSCLKCYLERRLAESPVQRIVVITKPYGGLLRNTDLIGLFLWVVARYGVIDVQVMYEYYGHKNESVSDLIDHPTICNFSIKYITSYPMIPLQQLLTDQDNHHLITCMTSSDMLNFTNTKGQGSVKNWETILVSLNTTRRLHVTRHGSMCDVIMSRHFSDAADDASRNHVTEFRVPLPPAETELTPLYPSGYRLPAEWYSWIMEVGFSKDKEYIRTHVQVDESDTRKALPHPLIIIQETDGLEEEDH